LMQDADQIIADCADLLAHHSLDTAKAREIVVKGMLADQPLPLQSSI
jgi:heterodisulfide reductase subunit D